MIVEATELDEILAEGVDATIQEFIQRYFVQFISRGMTEQDAVKTIIELCDEFFGAWRSYGGYD